MQSVHGADRLSATVYFLIKHTTRQFIQTAGFSMEYNFDAPCIVRQSSYYIRRAVDATLSEKFLIYPELAAAPIVQFQ